MSLSKVITVLCAFQTFLLIEVLGGGSIHVGMEKAAHAYEVVCEYEVESTDRCKGAMNQHRLNILRSVRDHNDETSIRGMFGYWAKMQHLALLPKVYQDACGKYLHDDPEAQPPADESDAMQDAGMDYPFKAFAHCMMHTLRAECGGVMPPEVEEAKAAADAPEEYND